MRICCISSRRVRQSSLLLSRWGYYAASAFTGLGTLVKGLLTNSVASLLLRFRLRLLFYSSNIVDLVRLLKASCLLDRLAILFGLLF